jgi:hypothetical protein
MMLPAGSNGPSTIKLGEKRDVVLERYQNISPTTKAMDLSFEEARLRDYGLGRRWPSASLLPLLPELRNRIYESVLCLRVAPGAKKGIYKHRRHGAGCGMPVIVRVNSRMRAEVLVSLVTWQTPEIVLTRCSIGSYLLTRLSPIRR